MKHTLVFLTLISTPAFGFWSKEKPSWKLYKDTMMNDYELYLILDMKYFGSSIQEEECKRLKNF